MRERISVEVKARLALRIIGWTATLFGAATWTMSGVVMAAVASGSASAVMAGVGVLPCVPFWISEVRRLRGRRVSAPVQQFLGRGSAEAPPRVSRDATLLAAGAAAATRLERAALLHVDDHVARLRRLLEANERTDRLGGASSSTLRRQVEQLRALLVALADEAVEHQASLASDDPVPVTLAEAHERLATTTRAYRELRQPEEARDLQQPG